jgi:hypothetical protein
MMYRKLISLVVLVVLVVVPGAQAFTSEPDNVKQAYQNKWHLNKSVLSSHVINAVLNSKKSNMPFSGENGVSTNHNDSSNEMVISTNRYDSMGHVVSADHNNLNENDISTNHNDSSGGTFVSTNRYDSMGPIVSTDHHSSSGNIISTDHNDSSGGTSISTDRYEPPFKDSVVVSTDHYEPPIKGVVISTDHYEPPLGDDDQGDDDQDDDDQDDDDQDDDDQDDDDQDDDDQDDDDQDDDDQDDDVINLDNEISKCSRPYPLDIDGHWAEIYIRRLYDLCIVEGYKNGKFMPEQHITRAELVKMALFSKGIEPKQGCYDEDCGSPFMDLDMWQGPWIRKAWDLSIIQGYSYNRFKPNQPITRAEAVKVILATYGYGPRNVNKSFFNDVSGWSVGWIEQAHEIGLVQGIGNGNFDPNRAITRAEAAKVIAKMMEYWNTKIYGSYVIL